MTFNKRITTAIATGAILVNALAPVAFAQEITVNGNGAFSDNAVGVSNNSGTAVNQTNNANVVNKVSSNANSGGNSSKFNTGGNTTIDAGKATTSTTVTNGLNLNKVSLPDCGTCGVGATDVTIKKNGAGSDNAVGVQGNSTVNLNQVNTANVKNYVDANANSGKNDSKFNTGGNNSIETGAALTVVDVTTLANANVAKIGGGNGSLGGSSVVIGGPTDEDGNGAFSDNEVALTQNSAVVLNQDNSAHIKNIVDAKSNSGKNDSKFNTAGNNSIKAGKAETGVAVTNAVNFNFASVDCDCVLGDGLDVTIEKNGAKSASKVGATLNHALLDNQDNGANLWNDVDGSAKSGSNESEYSTGGTNGTETGMTVSATDVTNLGNVNILNDGHTVHLPGNLDLDVDFDLSDLLSSLNHWLV